MADPSHPIRAANGVIVPLETWARSLAMEAAIKAAHDAVSEHRDICPARRFFWILVGATATGAFALIAILVRELVAGYS